MAEYHSPDKEVRILEETAQGRVELNGLTVKLLVPDSEEVLTQRMGICHQSEGGGALLSKIWDNLILTIYRSNRS